MSRNFLNPQVDGASKAPLNARAGRYQLKRRIGRGVSVRRRMTTKGWLTQTGGVALIAVGVAASILGLVTDFRLAGGQPVALMIAGVQATTVGVILVCYQQLLIRSTRNEEALLFQYDIGYEDGHRDCQKSHRSVVVPLDSRRPCECQKARHRADKVAVKVGDRG